MKYKGTIGRTNKFTPRKFITQDTFKKISKLKNVIINELIKSGVNIQTTNLNNLNNILLEELGEFANYIKNYTIKNH